MLGLAIFTGFVMISVALVAIISSIRDYHIGRISIRSVAMSVILWVVLVGLSVWIFVALGNELSVPKT